MNPRPSIVQMFEATSAIPLLRSFGTGRKPLVIEPTSHSRRPTTIRRHRPLGASLVRYHSEPLQIPALTILASYPPAHIRRIWRIRFVGEVALRGVVRGFGRETTRMAALTLFPPLGVGRGVRGRSTPAGRSQSFPRCKASSSRGPLGVRQADWATLRRSMWPCPPHVALLRVFAV